MLAQANARKLQCRAACSNSASHKRTHPGGCACVHVMYEDAMQWCLCPGVLTRRSVAARLKPVNSCAAEHTVTANTSVYCRAEVATDHPEIPRHPTQGMFAPTSRYGSMVFCYQVAQTSF